MSAKRKTIIFDNGAQSGQSDHFYSNTPSVQLVEIDPGEYQGPHYNGQERQGRTEPQSKALARVLDELKQRPEAPPLPAEDALFGPSLDWPYRGYEVRPLSHSSRAAQGLAGYEPADARGKQGQAPLGRWPDQPVRGGSPAGEARGYEPRRLCLFNVIVALEWYPDAAYMQQLEWAFRRASELLHDITNGYMAFGQVVFGGPEWLGCADIQVLASTRLHPRSWVNGLHQGRKYQPIRVGRGLWNKTARFVIPWDEPEAYRSLVHEWAHYALGLKDAYLKPEGVEPAAGDNSLLVAVANDKNPAPHTLIIPQLSLPILSIMAGQPGASELHHGVEWGELRDKCEFKFLHWLPHQDDPGPRTLPLPLPYFHNLLPSTAGRIWHDGPWGGAAELRAIPKGIDREHCWVYVVKAQKDRTPRYVIAQGTPEAQQQGKGFPLLGAMAGDTVVLVGQAVETGEPIVKRWEIGPDDWQDAPDLDSSPFVDVLPKELQSHATQGTDQQEKPAEVSVRMTSAEGAPTRDVWIFPIAAQRETAQNHLSAEGEVSMPSWVSDEQVVGTLDGHVVVRWSDGDGIIIDPFSDGGFPNSGAGVRDNPTSGGSSEGNVMIFFHDGREKGKKEQQDYSELRVVTTVIHGTPDQPPPDASQASSYLFSIASNRGLPQEFCPTLIMFYDRSDAGDEAGLRIYRQEGEAWEPQPTYLKPDSSLAAMPLNRQTAPRLVDEYPKEPRVERYRLYRPGPKADAHGAGAQPASQV